MRTLRPCIALAALICWAIPSRAEALPADFALPAAKQHEPYFGTEVTFTDKEILKAKKSGTEHSNKIDQWMKVAAQLCKDHHLACEVEQKWQSPFKGTTHPRVVYYLDEQGRPLKTGSKLPDKQKRPFRVWWYSLESDNGVIEVNTRPMTVTQMKELALPMSDLYAAAGKVGLAPHDWAGGGHVHIDAETGFGNEPIRLLNFLTAVFNLGMFPFHGPDQMSQQVYLMNAGPFSLLDKKQHEAYARLLEKGEQYQRDYGGMQSLGKELEATVYATTAWQLHVSHKPNDGNEGKYQEICLKTLTEHGGQANFGGPVKKDLLNTGTVELRAFPPQKTADDLFSLLSALDAKVRGMDSKLLEKLAVPDTLVVTIDGKNLTIAIKNPAGLAERVSKFFRGTGFEAGRFKAYFPQELREKL